MVNQKGFRQALLQRFDGYDTDAILAEQRKCFDQLCARRTVYANCAPRAHLEDHILPGLAFYQVLREWGQDQGEALRITEVALGASVVSGRRSMSWLGKLRLAFPALRLIVRKVMEKGYPAEG